MARPTTRKLLTNMLENLGEKQLKKFCFVLRDRKKGPQVSLEAVDGKDRLDIAEVLVSTFTDDAIQVAVEVLREMESNELAYKLEQAAGSAASVSTGASGASHLNASGNISAKTEPMDMDLK